MKVGRYRILRQIARGGQGSVLLGYDPRLKRRVAIKLYRLPDQRERRRQALREARRSALLESPRITRVHDVLVAGDDLAVVMQYVPGCDLRDVLSATRLSLPAALSIASDLAAALASARLRNTVHGDIKPANVLIASNGRAMLTDFGVAQAGKVSRALGFSNSAMSPEHVRGEALCFASDMFALGVLLYHMVSGLRPFPDGEAGREAMLQGRFQSLADCVGDGSVALELDVLVSRLLSPDPRRRPASIHAVRQALRAIALAQPLGAATPVRAETMHLFRPESTAEVPPELLAEFDGEPLLHRLAHRLQQSLTARPRVAAASAVAALALGLGFWQLRPAACVELQAPDLRVNADVPVSTAISLLWLQEELRSGVEGTLGRVELFGILGDGDSRYLGSEVSGAQCSADYRLQLRLDCRRGLCLVSLLNRGLPAASALPLYPDASLADWRGAIAQLVASALSARSDRGLRAFPAADDRS